MEEDENLFVDPIHNVRPKETVSCEFFVVLTLEAINVTRPCRHLYQEGIFLSKVIPNQSHKVSGAVADLLGCGNHVYMLI